MGERYIQYIYNTLAMQNTLSVALCVLGDRQVIAECSSVTLSLWCALPTTAGAEPSK